MPLVAVNVYTRPAIVSVVNVVAATPFASVRVSAAPKVPLVPVFVQLTGTPGACSGRLFTSRSCAVTVTVLPTALLPEKVTTKLLAVSCAPWLIQSRMSCWFAALRYGPPNGMRLPTGGAVSCTLR